MNHTSLYTVDSCPNCKESKWEWLIWCSSCGTIVCSSCVHSKKHANGVSFDIPGRGKRYYDDHHDLR
jgi:hypothetical protein